MKLWTLVFCLLSLSITAQTHFSYSDKIDSVLVYSDTSMYNETSPYAAVLEDAKKELTIEQVRTMPDSCFRWAKPGRLNLGNSNSRFWVRFYIDNKTQEELYFYTLVSMITHIDMYVISTDGHLVVYPKGGSIRPFENRSLQLSKTNFNIGKTPKTLFVAIEGNQSLMFHNYIGAKDAIYRYQRLDERVSFFCCGIYFILALYNLVIFFNSRDTPFLWYSLFEMGSIFYLLHVSGYGYQFLWQSYPIINADANFHAAVVVIPACFFCRSFLNTRNVIPYYDIYLKVLLSFYSFSLILQPLGFSTLSNALCQLSILIVYFSLWTAGILTYNKKQRTARFYVVGWTIYLFAVILYMLGEAGFISELQDFVGDYYLLHIGAVSEGCFLAFALADRVRDIRLQARDANALALQRAYENEALVAQQTLLLEEKLKLEQQQNIPSQASELPELLNMMRSERSKNRKLNVPTTEGVLWIPMQDIIRLEAMRSYCSIYSTNGKRIIAAYPLSEFEKQLDSVDFMRVHKSHLVNLNQIQEYIRGDGGSLVLKDGSSVSVSRSAKAALLERLAMPL
jgi:two-component system, sensor histidine kinase LadS